MAGKACASAYEPFGEQIPAVEPYWYQGFPTPYYGDSHVAFRAKCRKFVDVEIAPYLEDWIEGPGHYPLELHEKALAYGLPTAGLAPAVQKRYPKEMVPAGGFDAFHELIYLDELARVGSGGHMGQAGINSMALPPILFAGSPAVQEKVVDAVISGKKNISLAISEPTAGSDVANIRLTAKREGDVYVLDGQKKWITGGHIADFYTCACRTGAAGGKGLSLIMVDRATPGITVRKMRTQFDECHGTTFITFDNVKVPVGNLIGNEGEGFKYLMLNFNHERFVISASACRYARLCYSESLKYAVRRKTFGKPLADHQMIRWKLAEMARLTDALHDMNERVAFMYKSGVPDSRLGGQCALLKVMCSKNFEFCAREASQIFGGNSIVKEGPGKLIERMYRDVRGQAIPGGSEEILLDLAARQAISGAARASNAANAKL